MTATVEALRLALQEARAEEARCWDLHHEATDRRCRAVVALADATGEAGYESRWCRAWLAGAYAECSRLTAEQYPQSEAAP